MRILCYLGHKFDSSKKLTLFADLTQVYKNNPLPISLPKIDHLELDIDIKSVDPDILPGKLFYYSPDGKLKFEPIKFSQYNSMIEGFRLFTQAVRARPYIVSKGLKWSLNNRILNLLNEYYSNVVKIESRNQMIDDILLKNP